MGFTIKDEIELGKSGVRVSRAYITFGFETLRVKGLITGDYEVECLAHVYSSKQSFIDKKDHLDVIFVREKITEAQLNGNLFKRLYNILKTKYVNTEDD